MAHMYRFLAIFLTVSALYVPANAQTFGPQQERFAQEWLDELGALSNPRVVQQRVGRIRQQLNAHSGKDFAIYPIPTSGNIGLALNGGVILLDGGTLGKSEEVLAFWLAHEWGHQDRGHSINRFSSPAQFQFARARLQFYPSANEDEADIYAGQFLARFGYAIAPVLENLCNLPPSSGNHSSSAARATNVALAYQQISGVFVGSPCGEPTQDRRADTSVDPQNYQQSRSDTFEENIIRDFSEDERLCRESNYQACHRAGRSLSYQRGGDYDIDRAIASYIIACEEGQVSESCYELSRISFNDRYEREDADRYYFYAREACRLNSAAGCGNEGFAYDLGIGTDRNRSRALTPYRSACAEGLFEFCTSAGIIYANRDEPNYERAFSLFRRACEGEYYEGCFRMGTLLADGDGVAENKSIAATFYEMACDGKYYQACWALAAVYEDGRGREVSYPRAYDLYRLSCENGKRGACLEYGRMLVLGRGVARDRTQGLAIIRERCREPEGVISCRWLENNGYSR